MESFVKKIVVLDRGWIVVGRLEKDEDYFILLDGAVIRRWGTENGLGELAEKGPLPETKLDPLPLTKFHRDQVIFIINCSEEKRKK
jgi:hypothetical protein